MEDRCIDNPKEFVHILFSKGLVLPDFGCSDWVFGLGQVGGNGRKGLGKAWLK